MNQNEHKRTKLPVRPSTLRKVKAIRIFMRRSRDMFDPTAIGELSTSFMRSIRHQMKERSKKAQRRRDKRRINSGMRDE